MPNQPQQPAASKSKGKSKGETKDKPGTKSTKAAKPAKSAKPAKVSKVSKVSKVAAAAPEPESSGRTGKPATQSKALRRPKAPETITVGQLPGAGQVLEQEGAGAAEAAPQTLQTPYAPSRATSPKSAAPHAEVAVFANEDRMASEVTFERIAVRAYFLSENRHAHGVPGDSQSDWHEAERQLRAESAAIADSARHGD